MKNLQKEIDDQIQMAAEVKDRHGYKETANVNKLWYSKRRFTIGFNFKQGVVVGDIYHNDDGSRCEVVALV